MSFKGLLTYSLTPHLIFLFQKFFSFQNLYSVLVVQGGICTLSEGEMQTNLCSLKIESLIFTSVFAESNSGQRSYRDMMFTNLSLLGFWTQCVDFILMRKIEFSLFLQQSTIKLMKGEP